MISFKITSLTIPDGLLTEFRQYASIPDSDTRTDNLETFLRSAILRVQAYADKAFAPCACTLERTVPDGRRVRLYLGGGTVTGVSDSDGAAVEYARMASDVIKVQATPGSVVTVTYGVTPADGTAAHLKATVLRYATALYDGAPQEELGAILNEVL